jgi:hypothetical protein
MPYFVFSVDPEGQTKCLDKYAKYREARDYARNLRNEQAPGQATTFKLIFASNEIEAEKLLTTPREAPIEGDD